MKYIDKSGCKPLERGITRNIQSLGALTREAARIAEQNRLGIMKTHQGCYRIITESGTGAYEDILGSLSEADDFLRNLDRHESTRYGRDAERHCNLKKISSQTKSLFGKLNSQLSIENSNRYSLGVNGKNEVTFMDWQTNTQVNGNREAQKAIRALLK